MNLKECTRADLIWIIERMKFYDETWYPYALKDLISKKELECLEEVNKQLKIALDAKMKYCEILKPYEGVQIVDIPVHVFEKANDMLKIAQAADDKWKKLTKIQKEEEEKEAIKAKHRDK